MSMIVTENECVDCGLPCIHESCRHWAVTRFYCDKCHEDVENLYYFEDQELCIDCIEQQLERVEYYE